MDFSAICRTCLGTKYLTPIFREQDQSRYADAMFVTLGLKIDQNDGLPQQLCKNCIKLIEKSLNFRRQAKDAETQLFVIKNQKDKDSIELKEIELISTENQQSEIDVIDIKYNAMDSNTDIYKITLKDVMLQKTDIPYMKDDIKLETSNTNDAEDNFPPCRNNTGENNKQKNKSDDSEIHEYDEEYLDQTLDTESDTGYVMYIKDSDLKQNVNSDKLYDLTNMESMPFVVQESNRVTCKLCQKDLSIRSIDSHMAKRHPGADARKVKCDLCDSYVLKTKLNRHLIHMHGKDCFRCKYCKTEYFSKQLLLEHVPTCTAKNKKSSNGQSKTKDLIECDICHKAMQRSSLRLHKDIKHAGMGPVCEHCGRRFGNKFRLNEHLRAKHDYEKFRCTACDFTSASSMAMRNHERRHRGERPFSCDACRASFHAPHLLAQHKQSHRTEKLMKCDLCPAAFKANNTLHVHKITCHNNQTYQCNMCPKTYSCRNYAVKHLRNVHRYSGPVGSLQRASKQPEVDEDGDAFSVQYIVGK